MTSGPFAVVLLDVDGTLVHAGGAGRRALERALAERCGPSSELLADLRLDGMTDRLIVREAMALLGRPFTDEICDGVLERYLVHLAEELRGPGYAVLPGVVALLEGLVERGIAFGLCTGNVVEGARLKLSRGGLDRFFGWDAAAIGGFAHDGEARERVVAAALERARRRLGRALHAHEALVVGDTPRDVAAARHVGCPVLAVATGRYAAPELAASGADHVAGTLADPAALRLVLG
jgi:phosphoglycolate phosphatase-like HAD superfamily hydrolase